jgi:hypothetical protein
LGVRVDRVDLVAALTEPLVNGIAAMAPGITGDARHGDALLRQELGGGVLD